MNFWEKLQKPIIGLAPMDGVTDVAYREMMMRHGNPDLMITEFIAVDGIVRMAHKLLRDFWYTDKQRPIVAQIYGNDPKLFYYSTQLVCELGFDGVDINMGCPAKSVVHRGCGAALCDSPNLAQEIISSCQNAVTDWVKAGIDWDNWPIINPDKAQRLFREFILTSQEKQMYQHLQVKEEKVQNMLDRKAIPVSVKTRVGFREPVVKNWTTSLLEMRPAAISIHGRTLRQMYRGEANWDLIADAVAVRDSFGSATLILGNGDIKDADTARQRIEQTRVDGVLIGCGTFGNPWIFPQIRGDRNTDADLKEKFEVMLEHAKLHQYYKESSEFVQMRKNLAWYVSSFPGASQLRSKLVQVNDVAEIEAVLQSKPWQF